MKRCQAMIEAGIEHPESQEGKDFCTRMGKYKESGCPYDKCIVFEYNGRSSSLTKRNLRAARAKKMASEGYSIPDIARALRMGKRTIHRYLG